MHLSSPCESVAMTFFGVRHELRMWHDCGVTRSGDGAILANSRQRESSLHSKFPWQKKWCDIFDALGRKQQAGENSEFESPHRLFGHGGARNRALVGGLDNPKLRTAPGYPAMKLAGGSLPKDKTLDHSAPIPTASQPQPRAVTFHGVHSVWALVRWSPPLLHN
jgi:hypothetical protein